MARKYFGHIGAVDCPSKQHSIYTVNEFAVNLMLHVATSDGGGEETWNPQLRPENRYHFNLGFRPATIPNFCNQV